eukprot:2403684-Pyramimonas_sp.AAC.1
MEEEGEGGEGARGGGGGGIMGGSCCRGDPPVPSFPTGTSTFPLNFPVVMGLLAAGHMAFFHAWDKGNAGQF